MPENCVFYKSCNVGVERIHDTLKAFDPALQGFSCP
jgi:hypothetical protein